MKKHDWKESPGAAICPRCMTIRNKIEGGRESWQRPSDFKPKVVKAGKIPWGCR